MGSFQRGTKTNACVVLPWKANSNTSGIHFASNFCAITGLLSAGKIGSVEAMRETARNSTILVRQYETAREGESYTAGMTDRACQWLIILSSAGLRSGVHLWFNIAPHTMAWRRLNERRLNAIKPAVWSNDPRANCGSGFIRQTDMRMSDDAETFGSNFPRDGEWGRRGSPPQT